MQDAPLDFVDIENPLPEPDGEARWRIARRARPAQGDGATAPGLFWLGGFASDMEGCKAQYVDRWAAERGRSFTRFDYSGHGRSGGRFENGCIGNWLAQAQALIETTRGRQIVIGTSMGAWIALLLARSLAGAGRADRLAGLILLAPAVDFTEALMEPALTAQERRALAEDGVYLRASQYAPEPTPITRRLIEEGRRHLLLGGEIRAHAPVHILQGMKDPDVPWRHALTLVEHLHADPTTLSFIADGDHRLSREEDLARLGAAIELMSGPAPGAPTQDRPALDLFSPRG